MGHGTVSGSGVAGDREYQGTVLIPVGPGDMAWIRLLDDLRVLPATWEIVLIGTEPAPAAFAADAAADQAPRRWLRAARGRARQLNTGARQARGEYVWILHADSRLTPRGWQALQRGLARAPEALHYFNLRFLSDGPGLMAVNTAGVWLRSHALGLPFGDQGFCLRRTTLAALGGFDEQAAYGEDHLLVWAAKAHALALRCTGASLATSARKYAAHGWASTTLRHLYLTAVQAKAGWERCRS